MKEEANLSKKKKGLGGEGRKSKACGVNMAKVCLSQKRFLKVFTPYNE